LATWQEMGLENLKAAKELLVSGFYRSSLSRSYYAAYCAVTSELAGKYTFAHDGNNPAHTDLPNMILFNLTSLPVSRRWEIKKAFVRLRAARVEADYVPSAFIDRTIAVAALRDANLLLLALGVRDE
jgi:uncharacterized protein (UPF0332 family)